MKITKKTIRTYEVGRPQDCNETLAKFIESRDIRGLPTEEFEACFWCDKPLPFDGVPMKIWVTHDGNRFVCEKCAEKIRKGYDEE